MSHKKCDPRHISIDEGAIVPMDRTSLIDSISALYSAIKEHSGTKPAILSLGHLAREQLTEEYKKKHGTELGDSTLGMRVVSKISYGWSNEIY